MTRKEAVRIAKENTLACWWPSKYFPRKTNWEEIIDELLWLIEGSRLIQKHNDFAKEILDVIDVLKKQRKRGKLC